MKTLKSYLIEPDASFEQKLEEFVFLVATGAKPTDVKKMLELAYEMGRRDYRDTF